MNPDGILSDSDKRYLASLDPESADDVWEGKNENQKRLRIRKKIQAAIEDFPGISGLPQKEYELIFKELSEGAAGGIQRVADKKTGDMVTIGWPDNQYLGLLHMLVFVYKACQLEPSISFENLLEQAISWAEDERDRPPTQDTRYVDEVEVLINITYRDQPNVESIKKKLEGKEGLTRAEIGELYIKGELEELQITPADLDKQLHLSEHHPQGFPGLDSSKGSVRYEQVEDEDGNVRWVRREEESEESNAEKNNDENE